MIDIKSLYTVYSPSGDEQQMSELIQETLTRNSIPYTITDDHQIYRLNPGEPLVCAHLDEVHFAPCEEIILHNQRYYGMTDHTQTGIGADDKNGVWVVLNLLRTFPNLSFIFSTQEEIGAQGIKDLLKNHLDKNVLDSIPYALIFDRQGNSDIIGTKNDYCAQDLEDAICEISQENNFLYTPAQGVFSDCNKLRHYVPCVNLSVGYYNAHSDQEYTEIKDLIQAFHFGAKLIQELPKIRFDLPVIKQKSFTLPSQRYDVTMTADEISDYWLAEGTDFEFIMTEEGLVLEEYDGERTAVTVILPIEDFPEALLHHDPNEVNQFPFNYNGQIYMLESVLGANPYYTLTTPGGDVCEVIDCTDLY